MEGKNFRAHYYKHLGVRAVEERKALAILLKEETLDRSKLSQFCIRYLVPNEHRIMLWKVLLGVLPGQVQLHADIQHERDEQFGLLLRVARVLGLEQHSSNAQLMLYLHLLEAGRLPLKPASVLDYDDSQQFIRICEFLEDLVESNMDIYWIANNFVKYKISSLRDSLKQLEECTEQIVREQDHPLLSHLQRLSGAVLQPLSCLPLNTWFLSALTSVLPPSICTPVWDQLVGGAVALLSYIAAALLLTLRQQLMATSDMPQITALCSTVSRETGEQAVQLGRELWSKSGSPLVVAGTTKESPPLS